jgi:hypothetical protein
MGKRNGVQERGRSWWQVIKGREPILFGTNFSGAHKNPLSLWERVSVRESHKEFLLSFPHPVLLPPGEGTYWRARTKSAEYY